MYLLIIARLKSYSVFIPELSLITPNHLDFSDRIEMDIDKISVDHPIPPQTLSRDLPPGIPTPFRLENLYLAGIPSNIKIPLQVPVVDSFNGDIGYVQVNGDTLFDGGYRLLFLACLHAVFLL